MEKSFSQYRNETGVDSDSDSEVIDNSLLVEQSFTFSAKKKLPVKNQTVFVAESESYSEDESEEENIPPRAPKSVLRRSSVAELHVISSSDDDASKRGSIRKQSEISFNRVVLSSSDEEEASPEMVPKRRPIRPKSNDSTDTSIVIGRKKNKRMILVDSDTENSIIIEHDRHKKVACLKDTPLKIDDGPNKAEIRKASLDKSQMDQDDESEDSDDEETESDDEKMQREQEKTESDDDGLQSDHGKVRIGEVEVQNDEMQQNHDETNHSKDKKIQGGDRQVQSNDEEEESDEEYSSDVEDQSDGDDGPDEDQMVLSRATRMSIMGVIPKDNDSDESDFIESDEKSRSSSRNSNIELPDPGIIIQKTPEKPKEPDSDTSRISCSPFTSPFHDVTNDLNISSNRNNVSKNTNDNDIISSNDKVSSNEKISNNDKVSNHDDDISIIDTKQLKEKIMNKLTDMKMNKENVIDDDVTIIDSKPEIIALSSDDEDEVKTEKSPSLKRSPRVKEEATSRRSLAKENTLKQYLVPPSYPNQGVVYVKKHVREKELSKLEGLKEDLYNVKNLLDNVDLHTLPDGGVKLIERLSGLEHQVRLQGEKVANMVVEPDVPTPDDIAKDGFDKEKGLSWDDIQKASNAVQPRMFGKQAMATHMAERNLILERLRDLHEALASRPAESQLGTAPRALRSQLMPHQLHALAWLRWRETQRPKGGILADDMGLGKTITMISLIVGDKEGKIDNDDPDDEDYARGGSKLSQGGTLVVCPASLMQQWAAEVGKHCAAHALSVCLHHGAQRATHAHRLATYDMVVTTYNILQRDNEKNGVLMKVAWRRVILDEAHIVRNHKSATSGAVSALRAGRRWCLTGTPVQNKDLDLFALLKFLRCTPFDDLTMWKKWIDNKSLGGQERLSTVMRCILLRRTKQQLQQRGQLDCLPDRTAHQREVTLSKDEMNVYQKVLVFSKTLFAQFLHQRAEKQTDGQGFISSSKDSAYAKMHKKMIALQGAKPVKSHEILVLLLRLRQVCCHCGLIAAMLDEETAAPADEDPAGQDLLAELNKLSLEDSRIRRKSGEKEEENEEKEDEEPEEGTTVTEAIRSVLSPNNPVFELSRMSSKIEAVMECLRENVFPNKGEKAVVVSQWTSVLRLVEQQLDRARVRSVTLSGNVPVPARPPLITAINDPKSDVRVMLLSLCAGGVGLNLCGANHLLLLDPHWNPQLEEQAQDRIYRVGQTKHVHIYRFMCVDTVEQSIRKLQQAKLELAENVLTGARNTNASKLTIEDLKMLFNMGQ